ncbi:MAG: hypothetical protein JEZ09_11880 [Salinivirgaceae bacterium]|nr:hypothetical protein [Salinivirgaceae bacterium]
MKKTILIIVSALLLSNLIFAQSNLSFRNQATGNALEDDLDLIYDPINLSFVKGYRLYTNLSNLNTNETLFNNSSNNDFLLGFSAKNPFVDSLWTSFLVTVDNSKQSQYLQIDSDLDGSYDLFGNGFLSDIYVGYIDNNNDDIYDYKRESNQSKDNILKNRNYSIILNNSMKLQNITLGMLLEVSKNERTSNATDFSIGSGLFLGANYNDPSYSISSTLYDLPGGELIEKWDESGDFDMKYANKLKRVLFSGMKVLPNNYEVRADMEISYRSSQDEKTSYFYGSHASFDNLNSEYVNSNTQTESVESFYESKGSRYAIGGKLRKILVESSERKYQGYWEVGAQINAGKENYLRNYSRLNTTRDYYFDGANVLATDSDDKLTYNYGYNTDGDETFLGYKINGKINMPFGERVFFGLGAFYNYSSMKRKSDYELSSVSINDYKEIDDVTTNDYIQNESRSNSSELNYEIQSNLINVPVGIEYKFDKNLKWSLRIGAIYNHYSQTLKNATQVKSSDPSIIEKEYGNGSIDIDISNNEYNSTSQKREDSFNTTFYTYGLGYNPTENLQIDLISFFGTNNNSVFDADFFRSLRISAVIKF